jgi:hypothetical protein
MKKEWKEWFINQMDKCEDKGEYDWEDRKYEYFNVNDSEVPFDKELKKRIYSLSPFTKDSTFSIYHIHRWNEGGFFTKHKDNNLKRKWSYVCELQPSECDTSLLMEGVPVKEGIFKSNVEHEVPKIKKGTRISLTVFGIENPNMI